ncbi:MAG: DEAD/DEAH box helicase [Acetobacteraceae bacterium]
MLPLVLAGWARRSGSQRVLFAARDDAMLQALAAALPVFLPDWAVLPLPAWDSLPYDRARPSRAVTGRRVATLSWLAGSPTSPALVLCTPESLLQRVPPAERLRERSVRLAAGEALDPDWLHATLDAFGYAFDDRVDEPGEAVIRPGAVDIHLAGEAAPVRLDLDDGRITAIRRFDPLTQRSTEDTGPVTLRPASEAFTVPGETVDDAAERVAEHRLPDGKLASLFDLLGDADLVLGTDARERIDDWLDLVHDAHAVARTAARAGDAPLIPPDRLYLTGDEVAGALARSRIVTVCIDAAAEQPVTPLAQAARLAGARMQAGDAVVVCVPDHASAVRGLLARRLRQPLEAIALLDGWRAAETLEHGRTGVLHLTLRQGFTLPHRTIIALRDDAPDPGDSDVLERLGGTLRIGDLVVEPDHGLARLTGLAMEEQAGSVSECMSLEFLRGSRLLVPALQAEQIWRYGGAGSLSPDRLESGSWRERREEAEREIEAAAGALVQRLQQREQRTAPVIEAGPDYQRFIRRMGFAPTPDQVQAIRSVQHDLAGGKPMDRLVCGDVGFGKTEVALHAAALAALAGRQVAVAAPTTLLANQHLDTFRRRLAPFGLTIEPLIRGTRAAPARDVLRRIRDGQVNVVVGTHAVAAARFRDLGLLVIDEEQRFGEAQKRALRGLRPDAHVLVMTATPLPRSLQTALVGLVDVSLLRHPPAARMPVRGSVVPFDPVLVRTALMHEARRNGQSFVVCPRIEDLAPMEARLRAAVPDLSLTVLHGRMRGEALDRAMMEFAGGGRDVLLATNIIEAGLDLPNANTMLIWRADRFGLAQLHQLRGRVGRGRVRASAYFLTDPAHPPRASTLKRLETVAALESLGAGFAVSMADLDQRGAGDLLGEAQAGHLRLIGTERYRHVLSRALARARGEAVEEDWTPEIALDVPALLPADFIPEPDVRLDLYRRLVRLDGPVALDDAAEEIEDRFGDPPDATRNLLGLVRLRLLCRQRRIAAVHAGPAAIALTPRDGAAAEALSALPGARRKDQRIILPIAEPSPATRLRLVLAALGQDRPATSAPG